MSRKFTSLSIEVVDIYFAASCLLIISTTIYLHFSEKSLIHRFALKLKVVNDSSLFKNTAVQNNVEKFNCYNSTTQQSSKNDGVLNDQSHARDVIEDKQNHSKSYEIMSLRSV